MPACGEILEALCLNITLTCAGNEAKGVIARLGVLPEMDVGVVKYVCVHVEVVEGLWGKHHAHIIPSIKQRNRLIVEV